MEVIHVEQFIFGVRLKDKNLEHTFIFPFFKKQHFFAAKLK